MNTTIGNKFACLAAASMRRRVLPALAAGLGLILAGQAAAQSLTTLYSFPGVSVAHGVILSGNTLYGTTMGGSGSFGTIFAVNTDGTGFATLYSFTDGSDGAYPQAALTLSGNTLYGTASQGGSAVGTSGSGTVFAVNTDGTGFTTVHSFTARSGNANSDGASPWAGLILSGNTLYGTAANGGSSGYGTVFAVNTDGAGFTTLHSFTAPAGGINSDGALPRAGLILSGNTLYGTASEGGSSGHGTVFAVNTDGTDFMTLHSFADGSDGALPWAGLILSGNTLYGTAIDGGSSGDGTVFAVNTDGAGFTALHSFTDGDDGANPYGELVLSGGTLYGTADFGGSTGSGTVFAVNTDGTGFILPYSFSAFNPTSLVNSDGGRPAAGLILSGTTLYGTTDLGGSSGHGTVFSLSLSPQFSVSVTPGSVTVDQGGDATYDLTIGSVDGFSGEVALSVSGLPSGATASFSASSVSAPGAAALTITTASTIAPGSYTLTITGTSGSLVEQATVILVVAAPNFSITASPSLQSVKAGSSTTYEATVTPSGGFDGAVTFSASGLPSGAAASFSPSSVSGSGSSTMTVTTKSTTRTGSTSFTITGKGQNSSPAHSTTVTLTVTK